MKKFLFIIYLLFIISSPHFIFSQQKTKINFPLLKIINNPEKQNEQIHFAVEGDIEKIKSSLRNYGGNFKYSFKDYAFISVPAKNISSFSKNNFVKRIEFMGSKGVPLNDTMKTNMNVLPVHQGLQPLLQAYDGTGVLIGVIDAGIELKHPDFQDSLGRTRVLTLWDQTISDTSQFYDPLRTPQPYNYGQVWDSSAINGGFHHHIEQIAFYGHGSHVSGIAAGDGSSDTIPALKGIFKGMAPNANLIVVSSNFYANDWLQTVADAVTYIFSVADSLNKPCVINISAGTYFGSHDGKDIAAQYINNLVTAKSGRAVVCAAGNAGNAGSFHLRTNVDADTSFTWFKYSPVKYNTNNEIISAFPYGVVYFELWADTAGFNNVQFAIGADRVDSVYSFRGRTPFDNIQNRINVFVTDTIFNNNGQKIAIVDTWAEVQNETYFLQVHLKKPDSSQYNYRFMSTGSGMFDVWSTSKPDIMGISDMVSDSLPSVADFPDIINYILPDNNQSTVSSFTCAPYVITVANYTNRYSYISYQGNQIFTDTVPPLTLPGMIFPSSSRGPTRDGRTKPDIAAPGAQVISAGILSLLASYKINNDKQLAQGGFHWVDNGTSMASPAVAGLAALYFQKCPNAGFSDFYSALTQNARTDTSTGNVPNNSWGYGKADAFAALKSSNFAVALTNPDSIACPGSVKLWVQGSFPFYQWSNGVTGNSKDSITVSQSGNYFATVTSAKGCKARTDTVIVYINDSLPSPAIVANGSTSFCDGDSVKLSYPDTFLTYHWSNGKTTNNILAEQTNFYKVTTTASNGCKYLSDSVLVSVFVNPPVPTISQSGDTLTSTPANNYQWYLDGNLLSGDTNQMLLISQSGYYRVEVFHIDGCSAISDSVQIIKSAINNPQSAIWLQVYPNPSDGKFLISISSSVIRHPSSVISIYNILGEIIFQSSISDMKSLINNPTLMEIDLSKNSAGVYFLYFRCANPDKPGRAILKTEKIIIQ